MPLIHTVPAVLACVGEVVRFGFHVPLELSLEDHHTGCFHPSSPKHSVWWQARFF